MFCLAWAAAFVLWGALPPDGTVVNSQGKPTPLAQLRGEVTVVGFISALCPVSNMYATRMNEVYSAYASNERVKFIFAYPNANENAAMVFKHAKRIGFSFPVYRDEGSLLAEAVGARTTPEFLVFDSTGTIRYQGAFDDAQNPARVKVHAVRSAIEAVLKGQAPDPSQLRAFGCVIHKPRKVVKP